MIFEETCNSELFETWVKKVLISATTKKLIEQAGCQLRLLPPYSPVFNPIENFLTYLKKRIREIIDNFITFEQALAFTFKKSAFFNLIDYVFVTEIKNPILKGNSSKKLPKILATGEGTLSSSMPTAAA